MNKARSVAATLVGVGFGVCLIAGCSSTEGNVAYPASQKAFFQLNRECQTKYGSGSNEIQKSLAFNECNQKRRNFVAGNQPEGWVGELTDISTDQGADIASVTIRATIDGVDASFGTVSNRLSDFATNSLITQDHPLFEVLAQLREGQIVSFDAVFLDHPDAARGIWESSITERGSMDEPEFMVSILGIRPYRPEPSNIEDASSVQSAPKVDEPVGEPPSAVLERIVDWEYGAARALLIEQGFTPVANPEPEFSIPEDYLALGYIEVDGCRGNCVMLFKAPDGTCTNVGVEASETRGDRVVETWQHDSC